LGPLTCRPSGIARPWRLLSPDHEARFGFEASPVDLDVMVTTEPDKLVRMSVASGFPFWRDSNWSGDCPPRCAPRPDAETGTPQPFFPAPA